MRQRRSDKEVAKEHWGGNIRKRANVHAYIHERPRSLKSAPGQGEFMRRGPPELAKDETYPQKHISKNHLPMAPSHPRPCSWHGGHDYAPLRGALQILELGL